MLSMTLQREEFAAARRKAQDSLVEALRPYVTPAASALGGTHNWDPVLDEAERLFGREYRAETGSDYTGAFARWRSNLASTLNKARDDQAANVSLICLAVANYVLTTSTEQAAVDDPGEVFLEWVTMHDTHVRHAHADTDGQVRPVGERFDVDGTDMIGPGDVTVPIELWAGCRCALRPTLSTGAFTERPTTMTQAMKDYSPEQRKKAHTLPDGSFPIEDCADLKNAVNAVGRAKDPEKAKAHIRAQKNRLGCPDVNVNFADTPDVPNGNDAPAGVPWHGVLTVEGEWSGDKRKFAEGALSWRPLPLPLTWQKQSASGHDGNITVGMIEGTWTDPDTHFVWGWGHSLLTVPEADEWVGLLAEFGRFGVSIDADSTTFEMDEDNEGIVFSAARGSGACTVAIPAFHQAFVSLGEMPPEMKKKANVDDDEDPEDKAEAPETPRETPDAEDRAENDPEPDPDDPNEAKEPSEAPVHVDHVPDHVVENLPPELQDEVKKIKQQAASSSLYEQMARGAGWVTNPEATRRIHAYWTSPGQPGYAKIGWGTPGDFNRCRVEIGQEIAEKTPEKLRYINQQCAQWQHDAIGIWPGPHEKANAEGQTMAPAVSLVAGGGFCAPSAWFTDPELSEITPMTITDDGHIFGHLATWDACHLDGLMSGVCTAPPRSVDDYGWFLTGAVKCDDGSIVAVGNVTLGTGHAGPNLSMRAAIEHYDNTGSAVADIAVGEDDHGIWYNGWIRPGVTEEQVTALRASPISGDWRELRGNLELIAALAVNVQGFKVPRPRVAVDSQRQVSLVASGVVAPSTESVEAVEKHLALEGIDLDELAGRVADQLAAYEVNAQRMAELREKVGL